MSAVLKTVVMEYAEMQCGGCGIVYYVPEVWRKEKFNSHESFHCPNGCDRVYKHETDEERLRKRLDAALARENEERTAKMALERKLARVENGTCPHCNRHFKNLQRHIKCKHS